MGLVAVEAAFRHLLATVPAAGVVDPGVPAQLGNDTTTVVYTQPGTSDPHSHGGRNARPVFKNRDLVVVEFHYQAQKDEAGRANAVALPALDAFRQAVWSGALWDRIGGAVEQVHAIATDHFGAMDFGSADTFGFRLLVDVTHAEEVTRAFGRAAVPLASDAGRPLGAAVVVPTDGPEETEV